MVLGERERKRYKEVEGHKRKVCVGGMKDGKKRKRNGGLQEKVIEETE